MLIALKNTFKKYYQVLSSQGYERNRLAKIKHVRQNPLEKVVILTVPGTLYVAHLLQQSLHKNHLPSVIITKKPIQGFEKCLHIVIAVHAFKSLPKTYIAYQLEQYQSGVYQKAKRLNKLKNAILIMDYSLRNINYFLNQSSIFKEQLYYVPIAQTNLIPSRIKQDYLYDVAFYGDTNVVRRQAYLEALQARFNVLIINNAYGSAAIEQLVSAKMVVNIHYYENALLETTRLYECISNGLLVISEYATDSDEHRLLNDIVDFVDIGNIQQMLERVTYWLEHDAEREQRLERIQQFATQTPTLFDQHFAKVLTELGLSTRIQGSS